MFLHILHGKHQDITATYYIYAGVSLRMARMHRGPIVIVIYHVDYNVFEMLTLIWKHDYGTIVQEGERCRGVWQL